MSYKCLLCSRTFGTPVGLKRHISEKHQYENINETFQLSKVPSEEPGLWDEDIIMNEKSDLWDEDSTKDEVMIIVTKINMIIKHN